MKESIKKMTKIIDELTMYFMLRTREELGISIENKDGDFKVSFQLELNNLDAIDFEELIDALETRRQDEVEEYYWQLNGTSEDEVELVLIGMMIDEYRMNLNGKELKLELIRKKSN